MTSRSPLAFRVLARHGPARLAVLRVRGRAVATPAFMPVGTQGTVKGVPGAELLAMGFRAVLANTYHLHLRPGAEVVQDLGGLHRFLDFPGLIVTDSGGFQVFSLAERRRVDDDGVTFRSHLDGAEVRLTPERAMAIQHQLDSDVAMVLDECPPADAPVQDLERAVARSQQWAWRSLEAHRRLGSERAVFAIVQGGRNRELRERMARELGAGDFDGLALGGISVGETPEAIRAQAESFAALLPADRPRYLMGVASPRELVHAVRSGIDLFDCVLPTRTGRTGQLFTRRGLLRIRNARHARDPRPLERDCPCLACRRYSRGVLRHLFQSGEMLGPMLATRHNLTFFARLLDDLRRWIQAPDSVDLGWVEASAASEPTDD